jgi:hypothetical protein
MGKVHRVNVDYSRGTSGEKSVDEVVTCSGAFSMYSQSLLNSIGQEVKLKDYSVGSMNVELTYDAFPRRIERHGCKSTSLLFLYRDLDTIKRHNNLEIRDASKEVNSIYMDIYH